MCNKAFGASPSAIQTVPECCKAQGLIDEFVFICLFAFDSVPDKYKSQEICDKVVSKHPFTLKYCPDRRKTPKMCDIAVDTSIKICS